MEKTTHTKFASSVTKIAVMFLVLFSVFGANASADPRDPDLGIPDSVYYLPCQYQPINCSDSVLVKLPIYLYCDQYAITYFVNLVVEGAMVDTAFGYSYRYCAFQEASAFISSNRDSLSIGVVCNSGQFIAPVSGKVFDILLKCSFSDTVKVSFQPNSIMLGSPWVWWLPLYLRLDTTFVVPDSILVEAGDCDANSLMTISDAVFLISYVFNGGCPPYSQRAADVNADCELTISDAVYLINYIFAGGPPPQVGCVAP